MFFYRESKLYAVRHRDFKAHFITKPSYGDRKNLETYHQPPLLYHLGEDPGERYDVAEKHPEVLVELQKMVETHQANMVFGEDQLAARSDEDF